MPEHVHDHARTHALGQEQGGTAMAQIVEPLPWQAGGGKQLLESRVTVAPWSGRPSWEVNT